MSQGQGSKTPFAAAVMVLLAFLVLPGVARAAVCSSTADGVWTAAIWGGACPAGGPTAADDVTINAGHSITFPAGAGAYSARSLTFSAAGAAADLTHAANQSLTVGVGGVTINSSSSTNNSTKAWNINTGSATVNGSVTLQQGSADNDRLARINLTTGPSPAATLTINGNLTFTSGNAVRVGIDMTGGSANGQINLTGTFTVNTTGTLAMGAGAAIFNYNGSAAQTVPIGVSSVIYRNLHLNNTNATGATLSAAISTTNVTGNIRIQSGILNNGGFAIASAGGGDVFQIVNGARFNLTGASAMPTGFTTFSLGPTSTVSFQGGAQTVATTMTYGHVIATNGNTKTAAAATPPAALEIAGNLTIDAATTFTANTNDPIINVTGNATIDGIYIASNNVARALTIDGNMSVGGTYTGNAAPVNLAGDFTNSGTFTSSTGLFTFNGTAAQALTGVTTFTNMQMNNAAGLTINNNVTVGTALTLTSGNITSGNNVLIMTPNCNTAGAVTRSSGHIIGNLRKPVPVATPITCAWEVGGSNYSPVSTTFASVTTLGTLTARSDDGEHPNSSASPNTSGIDPLNNVNRYWTLTNGGIVFTNYSATFNYVAGDNDSGAIAANFVVAKGDTCSGSGAGRTCTTWTVPTAAAPGPSATQVSASGMTSFSDFAVGQRSVNNFLIGVPANPLSTCNAQTITITARNAANATITNYRGTVSLNTSTSDGDWSQSPASGSLINGAADDGAATYAFVLGNNGVAALSLSNIKVNSDVTVTAVDITRGGSTSNSATMQFRGNDFIIANDAVQVAGRDQAMTVTRNRGSACTETLTEYAGAKNLKAWYTADVDHPSGAVAPAITGAAPAITTAVPGANNLTRTFTSGVASFTLATTDVGKYVINLRDDAVGTVNGTSATITTRPFALVVSDVKQGSISNLGGTAASGSKFIAAADTMQATVGAYRWNSAADTSPADGVPDAAATLAQIIAAGATPAYRWSTVLSAGSPFTPATGTLGTLSNGTQAGACPTGAPNCFTSGVATPTNLSYNEAGSFTLGASATNFLNSGVNLTAIVFDNSGTPARSGVIGRFFPDHFTLLAASTVTPACSGGGFSYMGQPTLGYAFTIEARNKSDVKTSNYASPGYATGTVSMLAENNNSGTNLGSRLSVPGGSWTTGSYAVSATAATFSRLASPDGPYDALRLGVLVTDADGPVLASRDMNPATSGDCVAGANCTGKLIGSSDTKARFGRLRLGGASGSQLLPLRVPVEAQYWNGSAFIANVADTCTTMATGNIGLGNYLGNLAAGETTVTAITSPLSSGRGSITLSAPGAGNNGSVDVTVNLGAGANADACSALAPLATAGDKAYLRGNWCSPPGTYTKDPATRARFGIMRGSDETIYIRENTN